MRVDRGTLLVWTSAEVVNIVVFSEGSYQQGQSEPSFDSFPFPMPCARQKNELLTKAENTSSHLGGNLPMSDNIFGDDDVMRLSGFRDLWLCLFVRHPLSPYSLFRSHTFVFLSLCFHSFLSSRSRPSKNRNDFERTGHPSGPSDIRSLTSSCTFPFHHIISPCHHPSFWSHLFRLPTFSFSAWVGKRNRKSDLRSKTPSKQPVIFRQTLVFVGVGATRRRLPLRPPVLLLLRLLAIISPLTKTYKPSAQPKHTKLCQF